MKINDFESLLDDFLRIPRSPERAPTLLEISGYPHLENVCSNVLEFYLAPRSEHGLDILLLESLLASADIHPQPSSLQDVAVTREATTESSNRIDIIVETNDYVIGIENKVLSGLKNPLGDYRAHLVELSNGRTEIAILLTLWPVMVGPHLSGFVPVTYEDLFSAIEARIGSLLVFAENRYLIYLIDFIKTLRNLAGGVKVNRGFIDFLVKREDDLTALFVEMSKVRDELKGKIRELQAAVNLDGIGFSVEVQQWIYHPRDQLRLREVLVHDIKISRDLPVFVDSIVSLDGWQHTVGMRKGGDEAKFLDWIMQSDMALSHDESTGRYRFADSAPYDADIRTVAGALGELLKRIARVT